MLTSTPDLLATHVIERPAKLRAVLLCLAAATPAALLAYSTTMVQARLSYGVLFGLLVITACAAGIATMWSP